MDLKINLLLIASLLSLVASQSVLSADLDIKSTPEQTKLERLDKEIASIARQNNLDTAKTLCVDEWSKRKNVEMLSKFATTSEFCKCVQDEMKYLVSDNLAINLLKLQLRRRTDLDIEHLSDKEVEKTSQDWADYLSSSYHSCAEKYISGR